MTPPLAAVALALAFAATAPSPASRTVHGGRFGPALRVLPPGEPARFVLLLSGSGLTRATRSAAEALARDGALVLAVSVPRWVKSTARERCAYPAGDLESLAQGIEKRAGMRRYLRPILVGVGDGATLVRAALAQAPAGTFLGGAAIGAARGPGPALRLCRGSAGAGAHPAEAAELPAADEAGLRAAVAAIDARGREPAAPPPAPSAGPEVADLPLVEVPATAPGAGTFALLVTGDGGWAGIDREIAAALAARGLPVVGLDSLQYFWTRRTPEGFAADLGRIVEHYAAALDRPGVALVGYSRGADVLPAATGLLAPTPRGRVRVLALLGPGRDAEFELHLTDFVVGGAGGRPILPDVERLAGTPLVCLYGRDEADESLCTILPARAGQAVVELGGGHHFGGDYAAVAREVVRALAPGPAAR